VVLSIAGALRVRRENLSPTSHRNLPGMFGSKFPGEIDRPKLSWRPLPVKGDMKVLSRMPQLFSARRGKTMHLRCWSGSKLRLVPGAEVGPLRLPK